MRDSRAALNRAGLELADAPVDAQGLGGLIDLIADGTISGRIAKEVFEHMWAGEGRPAEIVEKRGLGRRRERQRGRVMSVSWWF